ncbi:MAG: response regulator, partial [Chloroflexi bacterium]|nr:response regulator [Chloroflexota bacterium]
LVVDDDLAIRTLVTAVLADEGYVVEEAADGREALDLIERDPPRLILLDLTMPIMDGREFAHQYQMLPGPHAPIVCFAAAVDADRWRSDIDAAGLINKPFHIDELLRVVRQLVSTPTNGNEHA